MWTKRAMQQNWRRRVKEEAYSSYRELIQSEFSYDPKLEGLAEECEGLIGSSVLLIMYITHRHDDSPLITLRYIGDEGDGPTNHPPSPSN
jgi:hypothetical protein